MPSAHQNDVKKIAFTLAEVLITLGIIGIVASMTIPSIIEKSQQKQFVVAWRKIYSDLSNAALMISIKEPEIQFTSEMEIAKTFSRHLKNAKVCEANKSIEQNCWEKDKPIYRKDGVKLYNEIGDLGGGAVCMTLNNTSTICFDSYITIVDVNGSKLPNTVGKDIFAALFDTKKYAFYPAIGYRTGWGACDGILIKCDNDIVGFGYSSWYLLNDKPDNFVEQSFNN